MDKPTSRSLRLQSFSLSFALLAGALGGCASNNSAVDRWVPPANAGEGAEACTFGQRPTVAAPATDERTSVDSLKAVAASPLKVHVKGDLSLKPEIPYSVVVSLPDDLFVTIPEEMVEKTSALKNCRNKGDVEFWGEVERRKDGRLYFSRIDAAQEVNLTY